MFKLGKAAVVTAVIALGVAAGGARAAYITGSVSFSDGGLTLPSAPTTSIVSGLTTITQGAPSVYNCTDDFSTSPVACDLLGAVTAGTFTLAGPWGGTIYTYGGFTFTLTGISNIDPTALHTTPTPRVLNDALSFVITGTVDDGPGGFDPTTFAGTWTGQGSCLGTTSPLQCTGTPTGSWSISLSALGAPVPEPGSLALLGLGLAGLGLARRRKQ